MTDKHFHVYMTASKARGVIYTGMTSDLPRRAWEHRERVVGGFTTRYWAGRLVYYELHPDSESARHREYLVKRWRRDWKIEMIEKHDPTWADLFDKLVGEAGYEW